MIVYNQISGNIAKTWLWLFVFFALVLSLGWIFSYVYDQPDFIIAAALLSSVGAIVSYWYSDAIALSLANAKAIERKTDFPQLFRIVENLCIAAGLPMPKLYVINDTAPNAFATGRDKNHAALAVTAGLLDMMDEREVEGVIAHELSHIGNRDTLLMTAVVILAGLVSVLSDLFLCMQWFGGRRSRDNDREGQNILFLIGIVVSILAPFAAMLIRFAISRRREFLADANAVLITRYPEGLASALEKIRQTGRVSYRASAAIDHLYFTSPFGSDRNKNASAMRQTPWYVTLFSTHPPIEQRIAALKNMAQ